MAFVLDASMVLAWHFDDEVTPQIDAVFARTLDEPIVVPAHWFLEVVNGALVGERRKRATPAQTAHFRERLSLLDIEVDAQDVSAYFVLDRILPLARAHRLTIYDALYLELAERRGLPLAALDGPLEKAARAAGVTILEL